MALEDIVLGLLLFIVPLVILGVGVGISYFVPSKKRIMSILLVLIGGVGTAFYGIGFIIIMSRESFAGAVGIGIMVAVEVATLVVGILNLRKKPSTVQPTA